MNDLASKIAAGPPKKPVGLVKKKAMGYEDMQPEERVPEPDAERKAAMAELAKAAIETKK